MTGGVCLGNPVSGDPLNRGLGLWLLGGLRPYSHGGRWYDLGRKGDGTLNGGPAWGNPLGRPGGRGRLLFDGSDDYVSVPAASNNGLGFTSSGTEGPTFAAWIYNTDGTNRADVIGYKNLGGGFDFGILCNRISTDNYALYFNGDVHQAARPAGWSHVLVSRSGGSWRTYVNGDLGGGPTADTTSFLNTGAVLEFGRNPSAVFYLAGGMDDLRVWPARGLTADDARAVYADARRGHPRTLRRWERPGYSDGASGVPDNQVWLLVA